MKLLNMGGDIMASEGIGSLPWWGIGVCLVISGILGLFMDR